MGVVGLVLCVAGFWLLIFFVFFVASGRGWLEVLLGPLEPHPEHLGTWVSRTEPGEPLLLEERHLLGPSGRAYLVQRRYRDPATGSIVRVEPEREIPRRRGRR